MRKSFIIVLVVVAVLVSLISAYAFYSDSVSYDATIPTFKKYEELGDRGGRTFEVQKLVFLAETPDFTVVGKVKDYKFYVKNTSLRYSSMYPSNQYTTMIKDGTWIADTPIYFTQNTENAEGIIIFDGVPYSLYYNERGKAYVKCLDMRFNDYFKDDKTYNDFMKWAKDYTRRPDDEDLLS